jgi:predicted nucleic acid-binding Zn ribbon protein
MRRRAPRRLGEAVATLTSQLEPATPLAAVQRAWPAVAGEVIAAEAQPVAARGGELTVACRSSVWAQEIDLLGPELLTRLNAVLDGVEMRSLRCVALPRG